MSENVTLAYRGAQTDGRRQMNAAEHKAHAEELLAALGEDALSGLDAGGWTVEERANVLAEAQVHATLATIPDGER